MLQIPMSKSNISSLFSTLLVVLWFVPFESVADQSSGLKKDSARLQSNSSLNIPKRLSRKFIREKLSFGSGIYFSQGKYSEDKDTEITSIPFRLKYSRDDLSLSAQLPYIYITGPASVITAGDGLESDFTVSQIERRRWGFGDLRLGAQYKFSGVNLAASRLYAGFNIKVPTASEDDNLSSGEFDYTLYSGGFWRSGRWIYHGRLGYQIMGQSDDTDYNNRWYASLNTSYVLSKFHSVGVSYYTKQASSEQSEVIQNISGSFSWRLPKGWRLNMSVGTGFSESSADFSGGIQITKSFVRKRRVSP